MIFETSVQTVITDVFVSFYLKDFKDPFNSEFMQALCDLKEKVQTYDRVYLLSSILQSTSAIYNNNARLYFFRPLSHLIQGLLNPDPVLLRQSQGIIWLE